MPALSSERLRVRNDARAIFDDLYARGFTDGLPVIPPTEEAVADMLEHCGLRPQDEIAVLPPANSVATAEKVAVNAVMAGCLPEYLPVVIAALQAMTAEGFCLLSVQTTTSPVAPVLVINGPIRERIALNTGRGCMGPGRRANATIGRAVRLALVNIGDCPPGEIDKAVHGMPGKFSFCFGEREEESPWEPLHVERGFAATQSTVTVYGGQGTQNILGMFRQPENILHVLADGMRSYGHNGYLRGSGTPLVVMSPGHARILGEHGWDKQRIRNELFERTRIRRSEIPAELQITRPVYADYGPDELCATCRTPSDIHIVVAGGPEPYHIAYIPSFSHVQAQTAAIAVKGERHEA
jgi:hypothetical protein